MDEMALEVQEAEEIAKDCKLDYHAVNKRLFDTLRDVESIMMNQIDDVFELSKWIAQIIGLAGLKVCSESQWDVFSQCYNPKTGEVTPRKLIYGNMRGEPFIVTLTNDTEELGKT